jgi:prepilin-type N-terminal cleavage/methylation domain-containing protein
MRTCSAPIPDRLPARPGTRAVFGSPVPAVRLRPGAGRRAFVLVELLVVMSLLGLLVMMAQMNLFGAFRRSSFHAQVQDFISTMHMAAAGAAESSRKYEVVIDFAEQHYLLRQITTSDLTQPVRAEEVIAQGRFGDNCRVSYVEFDDGSYTNDGKAKFRAGRAGWQYGGKVVFLDESEQPYAVVVHRLTPMVYLVEGDPSLMKPKAKEEVPFR